MRISVIIATYNRQHTLSKLLVFLHGDKNIFEIIVVDDQSTDGTEEMVKTEFPGVRYLKGKGLGQKYAKRDGIDIARGDVVTFLDDDALPEKGWLNSVVSAFTGGEQAVQSKVVFSDKGESNLKKERKDIGAIRWNMRQNGHWNWGIKPRYIDLCLECGIFIRRDTLEKVPFFDPYLAGDGYGESISFSLRLKGSGRRILFSPDSVIYHLGAKEGGSVGRYKKDRESACGPFLEILVGNLIYLNKRFKKHTLPLSTLYYLFAGCWLSVINLQNCLRYVLRGISKGLAAGKARGEGNYK